MSRVCGRLDLGNRSAVLTIGNLTAESGMSCDALRYYERQGAARRAGAGAVALLRIIVHAQTADRDACRAADGAVRRSVTLDVRNMTCELCPITIPKSLENVLCVCDVTVDFDRKTGQSSTTPAKFGWTA